MGSKLGWIAREMKAEVEKRGEVVRGWRSLLLTLVDEEAEFWALTIHRPVVAPSEEEIALVRDAFGVPEDAVQELNEINEVVLRWPQ